jgi:hypothetical protein
MNKLVLDILKFLYDHVGLAILLIFVFLSHPFLKIPYDVWDHLIKIRNIYDNGNCYLYWPDDLSFMCLWHFLWAGLFKILSINDTFVWARIIHVSQSILAAGSIYYFSSTVYRILRPDIEKFHLNILSWIAVLLWFIGNGTHSIVHQQSWIMWYSVNYQGLTLPLFWYMSAIVLQYFFENLSKLRIVFIILQVIFISAVISAAHPSEQIYFFIHLIILCIIQYKLLLSFRTRTYIYFAFAAVSVIGFFFLLFKYQLLPMPITIQYSTWAEIASKIQWIGSMNVDGGWNRFPNSFSEIAILSTSLALIYRIFMFMKPERPSMRKCFDYLLISSCLFLIIPLTKITSGIIGFVTFSETVWRFVFASPWFIFIPFITYRTILLLKRRVSLLIISVNIILIISVFLISKYFFHQAFSGNVQSLVSSLDNNKVGIQYSREDIQILSNIIQDHERRFAQKDKPNLLYMRSDLGIIAKAVYGRDVYMAKVRMPYLTMESFYNRKLDKRYNLIDVDVPASFPRDIEIIKHFNVEKLRLSKRRFVDLPGEKQNLVYIFDNISQDKDYLRINGWAFIEGQSSRRQETYVVLQSNNDRFIFDASVDYRPDVSKHFGRNDLDDSGFIATIRKSDTGKGIFRVGLYIKRNDIYGHVFLDDKRKIKID